MAKLEIYLLVLVVGILLGGILTYSLLLPETEIKTETVVTQTVKTEFVREPPEIIFLKSPRALYIKDTVIQESKFPINQYTGIERTLNGSFTWVAHTSGYLNDLKFRTDFNTKIITNTVDRDRTTIVTLIQKGLFAGAGIDSNSSFSLGAAYLGNGYMVNVNYIPNAKGQANSVLQADLKFRLFGRK
jgi:hypothetical protein